MKEIYLRLHSVISSVNKTVFLFFTAWCLFNNSNIKGQCPDPTAPQTLVISAIHTSSSPVTMSGTAGMGNGTTNVTGIIIFANAVNTSASPVNGTDYNVGDVLSSGSVVIFKGGAVGATIPWSYSGTSLSPNTNYWLNFFSYASGACSTTYSDIEGFIDMAPIIDLGNPGSVGVCNNSSSNTFNLAYSIYSGAANQYGLIWDANALAAGFVNNPSDANCGPGAGYIPLPGGSVITISIPAGVAPGTYNGYINPYNSSTTFDECSYYDPGNFEFSITVTSSLSAPTGNSPQSFCNGATVADLAATGPDIQWYASPNGGTPLATSVVLVNGDDYYASQTVAGCESVSRLDVSVTTTGGPNAPVVTDVDNCGNSTLSTTATGTLLWSTLATTSSITVTASGTYSVTQAINGCTSAQGTAIASPKSVPPTPIANDVDNCDNTSTLSTTATGTLLWSTSATTSSITATASGTYSVTQTISGCTSASGTAIASPKNTPSMPLVSDVDNCGSSTLSTVATGVLLWSSGASASSITVTASGTYSVTQTIYGCTSAAGTAITSPKSTPSTPVVTDIDNCNNTSLLSTTATGALLWSTSATYSSIIVTLSGTYSVTQTVSGCTSASGTGTASPKSTPSVPVVTDVDNCGSSVLSTTATGALLWSTSASTSSITATASGTYSVTQTVNGCTSASGMAIASPKNIPSAPIGSSPQSFCASDNAIITDLTTTSGTDIQWYSDSTSGSTLSDSTALVNGANYYASQTVSGCESISRLDVIVTVNAPPPVPTIISGDDTLFCLADTAYVSWQWFLNGDTISGATTKSLFVIQNGSYTVEVKDSNGCSSISAPYIFAVLGVDEMKNNSLFSLYPDPAGDELAIQASLLNANENITLSVINMLGEIVQVEKLPWRNEMNINIRTLPAGIYFLQINSSSTQYGMMRFVKE